MSQYYGLEAGGPSVRHFESNMKIDCNDIGPSITAKSYNKCAIFYLTSMYNNHDEHLSINHT